MLGHPRRRAGAMPKPFEGKENKAWHMRKVVVGQVRTATSSTRAGTDSDSRNNPQRWGSSAQQLRPGTPAMLRAAGPEESTQMIRRVRWGGENRRPRGRLGWRGQTSIRQYCLTGTRAGA